MFVKTEAEIGEEIRLCEARLEEKRVNKNWHDYQEYEERIETLLWVLE